MAKYQLTPLGRIYIALALAGLSVAVWHSIWVDPIVADTAEGLQTEAELQTIGKIAEVAARVIERSSRPDKLYKRDAHPAPHGCVMAFFQVDDDLDERFRHGVLSRPGQTFPAWVRFSNGLNADDTALDARGMAVKLMGVPGEKLLPGAEHEQTQDFVMINHHTFPIANVDEFLDFFTKQSEGDNLGYFIGFNPFEWHLREMRVGWGMLKRGPSPLAMTYFSMLPYGLGSERIKFSMMPCDPAVTDHCKQWKPTAPYTTSENYLRDALIEALTPQANDPLSEVPAARFAFRVQPQVPGANMPIEDASIEWSQKLSPYVQVAELSIRPQHFSSDEQNEFCEQLSFNPWHALAAHRPIGGLNRARKVLYNHISKLRHEKNGVPRHEPQGHCLRLDGKACEDALAQGGAP